MSGVRHLQVSQDDDGQRLDRWLKKQGLPFAAIQKIIRTGQVRVDGKRAKPDQRLTAGQDIRLPPIEERERPAGDLYRLNDADAAMIQARVIYDDGELMAIDKPAGIASQGGMNIERHIDGMLPALAGRDGVKPRLVHRLDKETSGVMLLARSAETARIMGRVFAGRNIRKIYWALCAPVPDKRAGFIDLPIRKGTGVNKDRMVVDPIEGQHALTLYETVEQTGRQAAFVAFWPRTGRTNQIRIHAAQEGFPLIGDDKYGYPSDALEGMDVAPRLHLHASEISFRHPRGGKTVTIRAPLPPDLAASWKNFGFETKLSNSSLFDGEGE